MKPEKYETAKGLFKDTKLNVTNEGKRYLEAAAVTNEYRKEYVIMRVTGRVNKLKVL